MIQSARRVLRRVGGAAADRGASLVEYALMLALIAIVCLGALNYFGNQGSNSVNHSSDCIVNQLTTC